MLQITYSVDGKDLRSAMYYPHLVRYRKTLVMGAISVVTALVCFLAARMGICPDLVVFYFIAIAYLLFITIVFARAERTMNRYMRTPDCLIGQKYICTLDRDQVRFRMPDKGVDNTHQLSDFNAVVDMKRILLFYYRDEQVYIVPKSAFTAEEFSTAVSILKKAIKDRFSVYRLFRKNRKKLDY